MENKIIKLIVFSIGGKNKNENSIITTKTRGRSTKASMP